MKDIVFPLIRSNTPDPETITGNATAETLEGGGGDDTIFGQGGNDTILGGADDDSLEGGSGQDSVEGNSGDDTVHGNDDDDRLFGNDGDDSILGGDGNDSAEGGDGDDTIEGGAGDDRLHGDDDDDSILGGEGSDTLEGGEGDDTLDGGDDDDEIRTGDGADSVLGGGGNDVIFSGTTGNNTIDGGAGDDIIFGGSNDDSLIGGVGDDEIFGENGEDTIDGGIGADTVSGGSDDDDISGGDGNDSIGGNTGDDTIDGGFGDDTLNGHNGDDFIDGSFGADSIDGGDGDDTLKGEDGNDTLLGQEGNDSLDGGNGADTLNGGTGNDTLIAGSGNDLLVAGSDDDRLEGGVGTDTLRGNDGNDALDGQGDDDTLEGGSGDDTLTGGEGDDSLNGGSDIDTAVYSDNRDDVTVEINPDNSDEVLVSSSEGDDTLRDVEFIQFGDGTFSVASLLGELIEGDENDNNLQGTEFADFIRAYEGDDTVRGRESDDTIEGGDGDDELDGDQGNDSILGGAGEDEILGDSGDDYVDGGANDDSIEGGTGNDTLLGGEGDDTIEGQAGDDSLNGGDRDDELFGGDGQDTLEAGEGRDTLDGGSGIDTAVFSGPRSDYSVEFISGSQYELTHIPSGDVNELERIEQIQFDDMLTDAALNELGRGVALVTGLGGDAGFGEETLGRTDDGSRSIDINSVFEDGITLNGTTYNSMFINNNGNLTFDSASSAFSPTSISGSSVPIIAPYFADVDTQGGEGVMSEGGNSTGSNLVYWDYDTENDRIIVTWDDVGHFNDVTDFPNAFQVILSDEGDGNFNIEFRYESIIWTTGDASGGTEGLGGNVARAGWSEGTGGEFFELPASGDQEDMLELDTAFGNTNLPGLYEFFVREGFFIESAVPELPDEANLNGYVAGDPHIVTLDGLGYDFQAVGEYVLVQSTDNDLEINIQARFVPLDGVSNVSVTEAVATDISGTSVMIDAGQDDGASPLVINGSNVTLDDFSSVDVGNDRIYREGDTYTVVYAGENGTIEDGDSQLIVTVLESRVDVDIRLSEDFADNVEGLLGNADGDRDNDIALESGERLDRPLAFDELYGEFRDDWRVTSTGQSAFSYGDGEGPDTFYNAGAPFNAISLDDLTPSQIAAATEVVSNAGLLQGTVNFNNAVLDYALTGDFSFVQSAANVPVPTGLSDMVATTPRAPLTIEGNAAQGETLTANTDAIDPANVSGDGIEYQWLRDGQEISGANDASYELTQDDVGEEISVAISYDDSSSENVTEVSEKTAPVENVNDEPTGSPTINGTPEVGETLSVNTDEIEDADGLGSFELQWLRDGSAISNADGSIYTLTDDDLGAEISIRVSYTDGFDVDESLTSAATDEVTEDSGGGTGGGGTGSGGQNISGDDTGENLEGGEDDDTVAGNGGDDTVSGNGGNDTVSGGNGNDTANGNDGDDEVSGAAGDDQVNGGAGSDNMGGGPGNDTMNGGTGNDTMGGGQGDDNMDGGEGNDIVNGGAGNDSTSGGAGNDTMGASFGNDTIDGGAGNDSLGGGTGRDSIDGGEGNDAIGGGEGDDTINGGTGNDTVNGGGRNDVLNGDDGNDRINGGDGDDTMTGGEGADTFIYNFFKDGDADVITDFEDGIDRVRFTGVSPAEGTTGNAGRVTALGITDTDEGALIDYQGHTILFQGVSAASLTVDDFIFIG